MEVDPTNKNHDQFKIKLCSYQPTALINNYHLLLSLDKVIALTVKRLFYCFLIYTAAGG